MNIEFDLESSLNQESFFTIRSNPKHTQELVPEILTLVKLISTDGENKIYEEHSIFKGFKTKSTILHVLDSPNTHEMKIIDGDMKHSVITETFESLPNGGSKLTVKANIQLSGAFKMMGLLAKKMIQKNMKELYVILEESQRNW